MGLAAVLSIVAIAFFGVLTPVECLSELVDGDSYLSPAGVLNVTGLHLNYLPYFEDNTRMRVVREVYFSFNNFKYIRPEYFHHMTGFRRLDFSNCQLVSVLRPLFANMTELLDLNLAHNNLRGLLNNIFSDLPALLRLDISNNEINGFYRRSFENMTGLLDLNLAHNSFSYLPNGIFSDLTALRRLRMGDNDLQINVWSPWHLPSRSQWYLPRDLFANLTNLRTLNMKNMSIHGYVPAGFFNDLTSLRKLVLDNNPMTFRGGDFDGLSNLTTLNLKGTTLMERSYFLPFPEGLLEPLTNLGRLDLRSTGMMAVPKGFLQNSTKLHTLLVSGSYFVTRRFSLSICNLGRLQHAIPEDNLNTLKLDTWDCPGETRCHQPRKSMDYVPYCSCPPGKIYNSSHCIPRSEYDDDFERYNTSYNFRHLTCASRNSVFDDNCECPRGRILTDDGYFQRFECQPQTDNQCEWKLCQNYAPCTNTPDGFRCSCFPGFLGVLCDFERLTWG